MAADASYDPWAYILPELDAVALWTLAGTSTRLRAFVRTEVARDMRANGWFAASKRFTRSHYDVTHGTLFSHLLFCVGWSCHPGGGIAERSWARAFMRAPSLSLLACAERGVVLATFNMATAPFLRWCHETDEADAVVAAVLQWLRDHDCLPAHEAIVKYVGPASTRAADKSMDVLLLCLLTGRLAVIDALAAATTVTLSRECFSAALWSGRTEAVDYVVQRMDSPPPDEFRMDALNWTIALSRSPAFCCHLLQEGHGLMMTFMEALTECYFYSVSAVDCAYEVFGQGESRSDLQNTLLYRLVWGHTRMDSVMILQWAKEKHVFSNEDVEPVVLPYLASHAFGGVSLANVDNVEDEAFTVEMELCQCAGHGIARLFRQAGFTNVAFTRSMLRTMIARREEEPRLQFVRAPLETVAPMFFERDVYMYNERR